jgi:putative flippase GtrA
MDKILKFAVVGFIGFFVNTVGLIIGVKAGLNPSVAGPLGAEFAILSNFILNNVWTFSDRAITSWSVLPLKFIQFNILSMGSLVIQFIFLKTGEKIFGLVKFKEPILNLLPFFVWVKKIPVVGKFADKFSAYLFFYCMGVGVGMVVNFIIYSQIVWK